MSSACSSTSETLLIIRQRGDYLSMARGGISTADLAAKERTEMEEKRIEKERQQPSNATVFAITNTIMYKDDLFKTLYKLLSILW